MCTNNAEQIPVAVLGATGLVDQKAISLVDRHPQYYIAEVAASNLRTEKHIGFNLKNAVEYEKRSARF